MKVKHPLIAYFLTNIPAKTCQNRFMYAKPRARQSSDSFRRHSVINVNWLINWWPKIRKSSPRHSRLSNGLEHNTRIRVACWLKVDNENL